VRIWDLATSQEVLQLRGHSSTIHQVAYSPDGTRLASSGTDHFVKVWDAESGEEVLTLDDHRGRALSVAFSPDGHWLASGSQDRTVKLWDARPWTAGAARELAREREAHGLLDFLFAKPLSKADVMDFLRSPTIRPEARELALALVDRYRAETDPERYHQASWAVVRQPYLNPFQYRFALQQAITACQLAPEQRRYLSALGAAQYRAGDYKLACSTLAKVDVMPGADLASLGCLAQQPLPMLVPLCQAQSLSQAMLANLAFLTMAHQQVGQKAQAQAALVRLREAVQSARGNQDKEAQDLLREAEVAVGAKTGDAEK
jgi:hypothetical protein